MGIVDLRQGERTILNHDAKPARGLLHRDRSFANFDLVRLAPSADLAPFIEHFWLVLWDLTGKPDYTQENLPHPTQHLVIDPAGHSGIFGLMREKFTNTLSGAGRVIGVKFRPGLFAGFLGAPASSITDRVLAIGAVFDVEDAGLDRQFAALADPFDIADVLEDVLRSRMPAPDAKAEATAEIVAEIERNADMVSVEALARASGISARTLQRQFETYVGVGPKWVIDRYRMIQAVEALNNGQAISLTALAQDLGYFDQAHFTRTFTGLTGQTPSVYRQGR